jgi:hypothetical protein
VLDEKCAQDDDKPIRGIWVYRNDRTKSFSIATLAWSDTNIISFIDSL